MPDVGLIRVADLNTYQVISHGKIVIEKDAWSVLEEKIFGAK
jgi:ribosomal protein L4